VYNTEQCYEASHVYLPAGAIYDRSSINFSSLLTEVTKEYFRMNLVPPEKNKILSFVKYYLASVFIIDRMTVVSKPVLTIDVLDFEKIYRISTSVQSAVGKSMEGSDDDLIHYDSTLDINHLKFSYSLTIPRPSTLSETAVRRRNNSTVVGEAIGIKEQKGDEILSLIILRFLRSNVVFSSLQSQIRQMKNRQRVLPTSRTEENDKFGDDELLLKSLSFLHISDFLLLQATCKRWRNLLSYGLKLFSRLAISSRFDPPLSPPSTAGPTVLLLSDAPVAEALKGEEEVSPSSSVKGPLSAEAPNGNEAIEGVEDAQRLISAPTASAVPLFKEAELPPLRLSFVGPATVAKLLQLTLRNISELRLDRVVLDRAIMENMYYLAGRLRSLSLGLVKVCIQ